MIKKSDSRKRISNFSSQDWFLISIHWKDNLTICYIVSLMLENKKLYDVDHMILWLLVQSTLDLTNFEFNSLKSNDWIVHKSRQIGKYQKLTNYCFNLLRGSGIKFLKIQIQTSKRLWWKCQLQNLQTHKYT